VIVYLWSHLGLAASTIQTLMMITHYPVDVVVGIESYRHESLLQGSTKSNNVKTDLW